VSQFLAGDTGLSLSSYFELNKFLTTAEQNKGARIVNFQSNGKARSGSLKNIDKGSLMVFEQPNLRVNRFETNRKSTL
jgi:hypothetical protein